MAASVRAATCEPDEEINGDTGDAKVGSVNVVSQQQGATRQIHTDRGDSMAQFAQTVSQARIQDDIQNVPNLKFWGPELLNDFNANC